jgi:sugar phosphate isomerase/epimerase
MDDAVELLERWNEGIEILMDGPAWVEPLEWDREIRRFAEYRGPISVHGPIWELNLATVRYEAIRRHSFDVYKQSIEWAAKIGAEQIVIHPSLYTTPVFLRQESQKYAKENLAKLGEFAQELGIEMVVENVGFGQDALFDQSEFVALFNEIPTIKALVDVGHAHINRWDIPDLIRELGTRLSSVHLHDNDGLRDLHLPCEQGTIEWKPIWNALNGLQHEYRAILEYQVDTPLETLLEHARLIKTYLEVQPVK